MSKQNKHMQRGQSGHAAPGAIFGRAFRQTLIGPTFPNRNSVSLKSDIVSKQCPCIPLDTETLFSKSETFVRKGEDVVASIVRKCERKDGLRKKKQDEGQSHLHSKSQLDDTYLMKNGESQGSFCPGF
jgi:hypothetical protein